MLKRLQGTQTKLVEGRGNGTFVSENSKNEFNTPSLVGKISLGPSLSSCEYMGDDQVERKIEGGLEEEVNLKGGLEEEVNFKGGLEFRPATCDVFFLEEKEFGEMCRQMEVEFGV